MFDLSCPKDQMSKSLLSESHSERQRQIIDQHVRDKHPNMEVVRLLQKRLPIKAVSLLKQLYSGSGSHEDHKVSEKFEMLRKDAIDLFMGDDK